MSGLFTVMRIAGYFKCSVCNRVARESDVDFDEYGDVDFSRCGWCGGEVNYGFLCRDCGEVKTEYEAADMRLNYCTDCRTECAYCGKIVPNEEITYIEGDKAYMCKECEEAEENA